MTHPNRRGEIVRLPGDRATITGTIGEVGQMLARLQDTGRLVSATMPAPTGVPEQVMVNVRLAPQPRVHARPLPERRQLPAWAVGSIVVGGAGVVGGVGWLIYEAVTAIAEHAETIVGALLLIVVALAVVGGVGGRTFSGTFRGSMD